MYAILFFVRYTIVSSSNFVCSACIFLSDALYICLDAYIKYISKWRIVGNNRERPCRFSFLKVQVSFASLASF
jgi:hypothetical protein